MGEHLNDESTEQDENNKITPQMNGDDIKNFVIESFTYGYEDGGDEDEDEIEDSSSNWANGSNPAAILVSLNLFERWRPY
ncbi:hypothetical protein HOLleu_25180 [Holothuria leucospilota]|uniref:Uncharacterized protein n=1 Tax=Holothuria leucospilota TaxID=206669 RepID=A0A9Q1H4D1_HOLLE|nr:hypothetical protein HOLleu_25180 [Holothuria leucospilota]